jgi:hypothetical protein
MWNAGSFRKSAPSQKKNKMATVAAILKFDFQSLSRECLDRLSQYFAGCRGKEILSISKASTGCGVLHSLSAIFKQF